MVAPQITLWDKLTIPTNILRAMVAAALRLVFRPITGGNKPRDLFKDVIFALTRSQLGHANLAQERYMDSTTEANYLALAKKKNFQPEMEVLGSTGAKALWMGNKSAEKVILFFHGGGYVLAASSGHVEWCFELQEALSRDSGKKVAVCMLAYSLAPEEHYPTQLKQAAASLEYLIEKEGRKPADIIIGGDSAGGNLTMALMSHLLHPHPELNTPVLAKMQQPLSGSLLISPWGQFDTTDDSLRRNANSDMIPEQVAVRWGGAFLGPAKRDKYNMPLLADKEWFHGLEGKVREVLVWGGGGEVLIDSIDKMAQTLKQAHPRTEYVVEQGACHEEFIVEKLIGYKEKGEGTKLIENWVQKVWA
ncbi:hypothetical protein MBLNU230_g6998t1 [Neophaeotheca triangularis]